MGNTFTEHSKQLRKQTTRQWAKVNKKRLSIQVTPKNHYLLEMFTQIPGKNNVEKFKKLIESYFK
jgi:hypothetical protein